MWGRMRFGLVALLLVAFASILPAEAQEKRYALLIGNQAYDASVGVLKNPHNDIALMSQALTKQGFEILPLVKDARRSAILGAVRELTNRLRTAGAGAVGFLYYSGHGAAGKDTNVNYLIPVDAKDPGSTQFWDESLKLDDILKLLDQARGAVKFVVFDACRNELQLPTRDTTKGLVPVAEQQGFFVAYASAPGRTATDRGERSGPYAAALAAELARQGLDHLNLFQNVKETVIAATGGSQHPWESNGLTRRVYLTGEPTTPADMALWELVRTAGDGPSLQRYLDQFPNGVFAATAKQLVERLNSEVRQRQQDAAERKALETRQAAELQKAQAEARAAHQAVADAEAKRIAAEKAARDAGGPVAPAVAADARATRDALAAAEEKRKFAELRVAALEKAEQERKEAIEILRKTDEVAAKKAAREAEAVQIVRKNAPLAKEIRLQQFMQMTSQCQMLARPPVELVTKPKYGSISMRDEQGVVTSVVSKNRERCIGSKGPARNAYYVVSDKENDWKNTDTVSFRVRYLDNSALVMEFEIDIEQRVATRTKVTKEP